MEENLPGGIYNWFRKFSKQRFSFCCSKGKECVRLVLGEYVNTILIVC